MKGDKLTTWIIILVIIIFAVFIFFKPSSEVSAELAKCIGENSEIYVQTGCHACETQEKMFGDNYKHLNSTDCFFEREKCSSISKTPTWIINGQRHVGVQSIENLKTLTSC